LAVASIDGGDGVDKLVFDTDQTDFVDAGFAHIFGIETVELDSGANSIVLGTNAGVSGISKVITGAGATSITTTTAISDLAIDADDLGDNIGLALVDGTSGTTAFTVTNLEGDLTLTTLEGSVSATFSAITANGATVAAGTVPTLTLVGNSSADTITVTGFTGTTLTGTVAKFDITAEAGAQTISTGAGAATITGGLGIDTINLGVANGVADNVIMTTGAAIDVDLVSNFLVGTGGDIIQIDLSDINGLIGDLNLAGNAATAAAAVAAAATVVTPVSAAFDQGTVATTDIYTLSSTVAFTTTTLATALATGGTLAVTANGGWDGTNGFLVAYDDNVNSYIAYVVPGATANDAALVSAAVTNIIELVGVTDASTITTANLAIIA
jgi:hypothetical protein